MTPQYVLVTENRETFGKLLEAMKLIGRQEEVQVFAPVDGAQVADATEIAHDRPSRRRKKQRGFKLARYFTTVHHKANLANLRVNGEPLSEGRIKVLEALHDAGKVGARAREIIKKHKLNEGTVQQTLHWLRNHTPDGADKPLVIAAEDAPTVVETSAPQASA
jgi:hypothetical protein